MWHNINVFAAKLALGLAVILHAWFPSVLGETTYNYSTGFTVSGYSCTDYQSCCTHCIYPNYMGTGDGAQCQVLFPNASTTSCSLGSTTSTTTNLASHSFSSGYSCNNSTECCDHCVFTKRFGGTGDGQECGTGDNSGGMYTNIDSQCSSTITSTNIINLVNYNFPSGYRGVAANDTCSHCSYVLSHESCVDNQVCQVLSRQCQAATSVMTTSVNYPLALACSGRMCSDTATCCNLCRATSSTNYSGDMDYCRLVFPQCLATISPTPSPTPTPSAAPKLSPTPTPPTFGTTTNTSTNTTSHTTETGDSSLTTTTSTVREIYPATVTLRTGQAVQFTLYKYSNGFKVPELNQNIVWKVVRGGGTISASGLFTAGNITGTFSNTVKAESSGNEAFATIQVPAAATAEQTTTTTASNQTQQQSASVATNLDQTQTTSASNQIETTTESVNLPATKIFDAVDSRVDACLQASFESSVYNKYFAADGEHGDIAALGERIGLVQDCMRLKRIPNLDSATASCLVSVLGQTRFDELYSGQGQLTTEESNKSNACFAQLNLVDYSDKALSNPNVINCLKANWGSERYEGVTAGTIKPSPADMDKGRECFNLETAMAKPPLVIETPTEQVACIKAVVGEKRFQDISAGKTKASESEQKKVQTCFEASGLVQKVILPPPPEQVPFIPEVKKEIEISKATNKNQENKNVLVLSGKALPDSTVDIYVFSQPIVMSTRTDANGDWSYELSYHLPEGDHRAYTIVRHPDKGWVRSEMFSFGIAYAKDNTQEPELLVVQPQNQFKEKNYLLIALGIIASSVIVLMVIFRSRLMSAKVTPVEVNSGDTVVPNKPPELVEIPPVINTRGPTG